jgi:hypothetical protein
MPSMGPAQVCDFKSVVHIEHLFTFQAELQYLDWTDLGRYIQALQASREHLLSDASYLRILHQQHLLPVKGESKKEAG